jgi:hypothetical protein
MDEAIQIQAAGVSITTSGTSASQAIPNDSSGRKARYVRVACTALAFIKFGASGVAATSSNILIMPGEAEIFIVSGNTHIAAIQQAAAGVVNVTPIEA